MEWIRRLLLPLLNQRGGGGKGTTITAPAAPDVGASTKEAVEAQVAALPAIYAAQQEWGPKLLQSNIDASMLNAPAMAELYTKLQEEYRNRLNPGWYDLYKGVSDRAMGGLGQGGEIPADLKASYEEAIRAAQSARGNAYSPISASGESTALAQIAEQTRQQRMAQAASVLGIAMPTGVPVQNTSMPSPISTPNTQSLIGNIYQGYGSYANASVAAQEAQAKADASGFGFGDIFGGIMGAAGAAGGFPTLFSDKNAKENFEEVDSNNVLKLLAKLKVSKWNYKGDNKKHIGPMAQDFKKLFKVGTDDRHIDVIDAIGILIAAVQQLEKRCV